MTKLQLRIGPQRKIYDGFKDFSLHRSIETISASYHFSFSDQWGPEQEPWPLNPQDEVVVTIDNIEVAHGYMDTLHGTLSASDRMYTIEGRDKTSDIIDCSAPTAPGTFPNLTFKQLCDKLVHGFGIKFIEGPGDWNKGKLEKTHVIEPGETIFESLDRASKQVGAVLIPDGKGNLLITNIGVKRATVKLVEGENAKNFSFVRDYSKRYSNYTVTGVSKKSTTKDAHGWFKKANGKSPSLPSANAVDKAISRYRPLLVKQRGSSTQAIVKKLVEFEAATRAAKSLVVNCTVQDWVQEPGRPWLINELVQVFAPRLGIGNEFGDTYVIAETEYTLSIDGGAETHLVLIPPDAFKAKPTIEKKKSDKKAKGWFAQSNSSIRVPDSNKIKVGK